MLKRIVTTLACLMSLSSPVWAQDLTCPHEQKLASCAEGLIWDSKTSTCVEQVMG
ncbi:MAG: hypothetical protein KJ731_17495 [Alphaproteobacteria bacterium]|jgi:hypothetical protein|nr:hypothetical protein [Alphaproteobacteria bacterium]MBU1277832.1 hypothetical protein [Alphaproteobacteria bacterium]MBU1572102.1 hypothetical protein [Alphaproteobacteria bacterium]MBU1830243.1 hypothetical protein [Alphaproteobacteria bacterium]MBU2079799.1 hypothetical protein [Alphaproteobacteria bacterium]